MLLKAALPIVGGVVAKQLILDRDWQSLKQDAPIDVTLLGILMLLKRPQLRNVLTPNEVTPSGMVMLVSCSQPLNALSEIKVKLLDIVTLSKSRHSKNELFPIEVTLSGITTFNNRLAPLKALVLVPTTGKPLKVDGIVKSPIIELTRVDSSKEVDTAATRYPLRPL